MKETPHLELDRALLLAPTRVDAALTERVLAQVGIGCTVCEKIDGLCQGLNEAPGVIILPEESITVDSIGPLKHWLDEQPPWSDIPVLVLARGGANSASAGLAIETLGNVTLLERPLRLGTFVSAVRTALRARRRQYQLREYIQQRTKDNESLELRVAERTALAEQRAKQLRLLASELTQAESRERRRLAQLLHDHLQQLLVAAKLGLGTAARRITDTEVRERLKGVDSLINESIEASRSLTMELSPPILYEAGLGQALLWLARWMQEKHSLKVTVDAHEDAEPFAEETRVLLFQVARELLFNVVKHAGVDEAAVSLHRRSDSCDLVVEDQGYGFDAEATLASEHRGEHFGLFSTRERLGLLGGTMRISSAIGSGSRIVLSVPLGQEAPPSLKAEHDLKPARDPEVNLQRPEVGIIRIMLADDHRIVREGLAGLLSEHTDLVVVAEASDGMMAVQMVERLDVDVVVMDVTMPRMTGVEATRRIHASHPHIRVIGLSMHEEVDMAQAMLKAGAVAYLPKGGPVERLISCIRGEAIAPEPPKKRLQTASAIPDYQ
jgi:signal transduction histidine kinase/ActR/RegA family two-component response regulator